MTTIEIRKTTLRAPLAGLAFVVAAVGAWLKRRRDRRIIEGLSQEQLKDIGYNRLPSGELERGGW